MTLVPPGGPAGTPPPPADDPWAGVREQLAADVRRVSDRLRSLSATRLAASPGPSTDGGSPFTSRAQAGRAAAAELARAALALEAASGRSDLGHPPEPGHPPQTPEVPELPDLAVGDQVAVTGHDLLAALDLVGPAAEVRPPGGRPLTAGAAVRTAVQVLTDVRRRL